MPKSEIELTTLFLQSSIKDSIDDFNRSLINENFPHWDAIILTASNKSQAIGYEKQIEYRKDRLPIGTEFIVVPDEKDRRVGSGGSTLSVIKVLKDKYCELSKKKFLVIHAGGNSSRCPQYSALGKLFAPLPTMLSNYPATLFDMFLVSMASMPGRMKEGMLLLSGDVTLLFNPLMCDFGSADAVAISFKEDVETGKNHGVFVKNQETGNLLKSLQKQSIDVLKKEGAVDERNMCSIDTGAIWFNTEILNKLYSIIDTEKKYQGIVNNKVRLSLYADIVYCLSEESTLEKLLQVTPEGDYCEELSGARKQLWQAIGSYNMKVMNLTPAKFIHFGSIPEILKLMNQGVYEYESLGWKKQINSSVYDGIASYNSVVEGDTNIGEGCYIETSYIHNGVSIGNNSYISYLEIHNGTIIPDNVLIHGLKQKNGKFVCRIIGINDNPKKDKLFGIDLNRIERILDTKLNDTLWDTELYTECDTINEAIESSLNLFNLIVNNDGDLLSWKNSNKKSLCSGFNDADSKSIIDWNDRMMDLVKMNNLVKAINNKIPVSTYKFDSNKLSNIQQLWLKEKIDSLDTNRDDDFSFAIRLYYYLGVCLNDEGYTSRCFKLIADTVLNSTLRQLNYNDKIHIAQNETIVKLPLRVNWGGGWSDTCPHCLENGGKVLNVSIKLDGKYPVEVRLVKTKEHKIVFDSRDMDVHGEFDCIEPLQNTGDPFDPFALQKACLLACGIIPKDGGNLKEILNRLGGGFEMHSEVTNVPKGSGLGTSSILSAAAVKAMFTFMGIDFNEDTLYSTVLAMEQIMSTGGGWQDQVGGVTPGIKFISSNKGINQQLNVEHINISEKTKKELNDRFVIIYTGQRRLARNLLREVVGRYVGNEPDSIFAHKEIQDVAYKMKYALENDDVDEFARLLDYHWTLSQKIDSGSSNTLIDQIFISIEDLIDARMCCGAGGGGFLQVVLKKGVTKGDVHNRLKDVFQDFDADIWDCEIVY